MSQEEDVSSTAITEGEIWKIIQSALRARNAHLAIKQTWSWNCK